MQPSEAPAALVDTHAHLQWPSLAEEVDAVLDRAGAAGVRRVLTLGTNLYSSQAAVRLAEAYDTVYAAVGVHPSDVPLTQRETEGALDTVATLLQHPSVVAIGETGLDYYHADNPPRDAQIASFALHLELAARSGKPVCVHNREATEDVMRLVTAHAARVTVVLHCYTGDLATARAALSLGCYLSFAGNATYPKLRGLLDVAAEIPSDRLLVETDAPFLSPQPMRGRRNEPRTSHTPMTRSRPRAASRVTRLPASSPPTPRACSDGPSGTGLRHDDDDRFRPCRRRPTTRARDPTARGRRR